jgi:P-type E1-E2 ATPase
VQPNGVAGRVNGRRIKVGSQGFLADEIRSAAGVGGPTTGTDSGITSRVYLGVDGRLAGVFIFGDALRPAADRTIAWLQATGYRTALVSGDGAAATLAVGRRIGIPQVWGGRLPQEKAAIVQALQAEGQQVAMVGDGINDAPALAQADLALAVHAGSHLGREVADVTLMRGDPFQVKDFLRLAQQVNRKTRQNLVFSCLYNAISLPVAMAGWLTPLVAVCAMLLSSLSVIGNTLRARGGTTDGTPQLPLVRSLQTWGAAG